MAGKHSQQTSKSKAPVIIIIVISVIIVAAAAVFAVIFFNGAFGNKESEQPTTAPTTAVADTTAQAMHGQTQTTAPATQATGNSSGTDETVAVVVPTEEEGEVTYFNATFIPNGTVVDTYTGENTSLREVFGSGYNTEGVITFNSDGTFFDTIASTEASTGGYVVQNEKIIATYSNDKNMDITVTEWDGNTPVSFYIVYAGYEVYFG